MKPAIRFASVALVLILAAIWFLGGAIVIALTGGSEGHVSQKSDTARSVIVVLWLAGIGGGAVAMFGLLKPLLGSRQSPPEEEDGDSL